MIVLILGCCNVSSLNKRTHSKERKRKKEGVIVV